MYLIVLCSVLQQIVGLKTHGYDLAIHFAGLKTLLCTASDAYLEHLQTSEKEL